MEQHISTPPDGHIERRDGSPRPLRRCRQRPRQHGEEPVCNLTEAVEQAIALGSNRTAARNIRLHAYIVDDLCVAEDQHAVLSTLDAMLAMATAMTDSGSLVVCEAMEQAGHVVVRLQFAGEAACRRGNELAILDCDLRREWPRLPPSR